MNDKQKLIDSFIGKPTTYTFPVPDQSMIPEFNGTTVNLDEYKLTIKPPTLNTFALCATLLEEIPDGVTDLKDAIEYRRTVAKVLLILAHETDEIEDWEIDLVLKNVPAVDLLNIMQETALKANPSFFLNCIQVAKQSNPMILRKRKPEEKTTT